MGGFCAGGGFLVWGLLCAGGGFLVWGGFFVQVGGFLVWGHVICRLGRSLALPACAACFG